MFRRSTQDIELDGKTIPANSSVIAWIGSANHDESQFPDAERFDIERAPNRHLAFGHGIHYCLGARLGLLLIETAMAALLRRASYITLAQTVHWQGNYLFRAQRSLRVCLRR